MFKKIQSLLIGRALKTTELAGEKFNVLWGLPILSSDAISSVAYASEEILISTCTCTWNVCIWIND